jgi:hypothetical protein
MHVGLWTLLYVVQAAFWLCSSSIGRPLATSGTPSCARTRRSVPDGFLLDRWEAIQDEIFAIVEPRCVPPGQRAPEATASP